MQWVAIIGVLVVAMYWIGRAPHKFPFFSNYTVQRGQHQKQQWVRLLDIIVLGPMALLLAYQLGRIGWHGWASLLVVFAVLTMVYNYGNYRLNLESPFQAL